MKIKTVVADASTLIGLSRMTVSQKVQLSVTPAQAGVYKCLKELDSRSGRE